MSNTGEGSQLLNRFATTTSRITRPTPKPALSKDRAETGPQAGSQTGPSEAEKTGRIQRASRQEGILVQRPSEISSNVIFQDMDCLSKGTPKKYQRNSKKSETAQEETPKNEFSEERAIGVISNVFMGATTKFQKMSINTNLPTPNKMEEEVFKTPRNSETSSQHSGFGGQKFARKKRTGSKNQEEIEPINLSIQSKTPQQGPGTDRSNTDGKKIERRPEKNRQINWHAEKEAQSKQSSQVKPGPSRLTRQTTSNITQNTEVQSAQRRISQPVQRQNQSGNTSKGNMKEDIDTTALNETKKPSSYLNRQAKFQAQNSEASPQSEVKVEEIQVEAKPQYSSVRKPVQPRGRVTSQQEETQKDPVKQEEPKPVGRQPNRYGAKAQQITAQKPQQQPQNKPVARTGNRYGQNKVQQPQVSDKVQPVKEEKVNEVKPIQRNANRYQGSTVKQTPVVRKDAEEQVVESKPTPKTAPRYGANRVQQQAEEKEPDVVKPAPKVTPSRYGANKVQQTPVKNLEESNVSETKPIQNKAPRYGANRVSQTPVVEKVAEPTEIQSKPVPRATGRYGSNRNSETPVAEKVPEPEVESKPAPRGSNRYGANRNTETPVVEKVSQPIESQSKPAPRTISRYGANKVAPPTPQVAEKEEPEEVKEKTSNSRVSSRYGGSRVQVGANQTVEKPAEIVKPEEEKVPEAKPSPAPRNRFSSTRPPSQNAEIVPAQVPEIKVAPKTKPANQRVSEAEKSQREEVPVVPKPGVTRSKPQSQVTSLAGSKVEQKMVLKKSPVIGFIVKRVLFDQLSSSFKCLKKAGKSIKIKQTQEANILASSCAKILKNKESNLMGMGFNQLRKHFLSWYVPSIKPLLTAKLGNPQQSGMNLLHLLTQSKLRAAFNVLNNKMAVSNRVKAISNLEGLVRAKEISFYKAGLSCIWTSAKNKSILIEDLCKIVSNYNNQILFRGFAKILSVRKAEENVDIYPIKTNQRSSVKPNVTPVEPSSPEVQPQPSQAKIDKLQKLKTMISSLTENVSKMEVRIESFKEDKREATEQFGSKISGLTAQNSEIESELTQKKSRNETITKQLAGLSGKTERKSVEEDIEPKSEKLEVLANIYVGNFKLQDCIQGQELSQEFGLDRADGSSIMNQWQILLQNTELKRQIASFEQFEQSESKARKTLMNEQKAILKLVRSYIKQQYLWQWLHVSVEGM